MSKRIIAIDWSGAELKAEKSIWLAEVDPVVRRVVRLESGRSRTAIAEYLIAEARRTPEIIVGLDFAFSVPSWFLEQSGHLDAPALWVVAAMAGERWLTECLPPFWGKPGKRRPNVPDGFRRTERRVPSAGANRPKSVFQIGGAGAVGTGSIRGMPILKTLRDAGFHVWPFDPPNTPLVVEIYPRALTGAVVKSDASERSRYLAVRFPDLDDLVRELAASSEDAFDALVSALVMAEQAERFADLPAVHDEITRREGEIWLPPSVQSENISRRGQFNSSTTRVSPVLSALATDGVIHAHKLARLLDLAAEGAMQGPWHNHDLTSSVQYWAPNERGLYPPVSLLSWLIRNVSPAQGKLDGDGDTLERRRKLAAGDPAVIEEALGLLRTAGMGRSWHILHGPTYPDALFISRDALIVIEGKRTEKGPTTDTSWMPGRDQLYRHLDAAWEIRGRRAVYGFLVVEADRTLHPTAVPPAWLAAAEALHTRDVIEASLPHRGPTEQTAIAECFVGVVTWQRIIEEFGLPPDIIS